VFPFRIIPVMLTTLCSYAIPTMVTTSAKKWTAIPAMVTTGFVIVCFAVFLDLKTAYPRWLDKRST
jgi:hypothetical protein